MPIISAPGIGSGLDINSIVSQLVAVERAPLRTMQAAASSIQTQISSYGQIQSLMSTLRDAAAKLATPTAWRQTTAASSDATALGATSTGTAAAGSVSVVVTQLAKAQNLASGGYTDSAAVVGAGSLNIDFGQWDVGNANFTPTTGATSLVLNFTDPNTTLAQVRDAINAAGSGVTAAIVTDASGARLSLRSRDGGLANQLRVTGGAGLAGLSYDPPNGGAGLTQVQAAANALLSVDGLAIESTSNRVEGVLDGLTLDLKKADGVPVSVAINSDTESLKTSVKAFADAYNALNSYLATQTRYDAESGSSGALQGDSAARNLRSQLRNMLGQSSSASSVFTRLSEVGFDVKKDGAIAIDDAKLEAGFAKLGDMAKLFSAASTGTAGSDGLGVRLRSLVDSLSGSTGVVSLRTEALRGRLERNEDDQTRLEARVEATRVRLLRQYTSLDVTLGRLSGLSSYVSQQVNLLSRQSFDSN